MRKNERAFTMIELLAAIIIMGVLLGIAIPGVTKLMKQFRKDYYVKLEDSITESAKEFYTDNKIYKPDGVLKSSYTELNSLVKNKYTDSVVDYKGKNCSLTDSYVIVIYLGKDNYKYKTCLKCSGDNYYTDSKGTYCDEAWKTNDNIKYQFDNKDRIYVYYNAQREEIRKQLMSTLNIVKLDKAGTVLESVLAEENKEDILPVNIDELDTTPTLDSDNKKVSILRYAKDNTTQSLEAVVYKYKAPKVTITKSTTGQKYTTGTWANGVQVKLETNYSANWNFYELTNTKVANYQVYLDGKWESVKCKMTSSNSCTFTIKENVDKDYKFRIVTDKNQLSDETANYNIKVDVDKPTIKINPNGAEPIIKVGSTTTNIQFTLIAKDTGGSGLKSRKYAITDSNTTTPSNWIELTADVYSYDKSHTGSKKYVWAVVEDNAGNKSVDVYPSKEFWTKYEVVYSGNGGVNLPVTQYKYYNKDLKLSTTTPTRTGYKFAGWSTDKNATEATYKAGDTYKLNEATTLYAVWTPNKIKVRYLLTGGSLSTSEPSIKTSGNYLTYNGSIDFTTYNYEEYLGSNGLADYNNSGWINIVKPGYHAAYGLEWQNQNGKKFDQAAIYKANELCDATKGDCIAEMSVNWEVNKIYLYYSTSGGTLNTINTNISTDNSYITLYGNKVFSTFSYDDYIGNSGLADYDNKGWINVEKIGQHAESGAEWENQDGKKFDQATNYKASELCDATKSSCNAIMYVNWTDNKIYVYYSTSGGTLNTNSSRIGTSGGYITLDGKKVFSEYNYGDYIGSGGLADYDNKGWINIERAGYQAVSKAEWKNQNDKRFNQATNYKASELCDATKNSCDAIMQVNWTASSYTITFDANGGSVSPSSKTANYNTSITFPTPSRSGYTFNGWYTASSGGSRVGGAGYNYTVTYSTTFYAQWTQTKCNHTFKTRSSNEDMRIINQNNKKWPWSTVGTSEYGCTALGNNNTCITDEQKKLGVYKAYYMTCSKCGARNGTNVWCPVHNPNGGKNIEICDSEKKKYSKNATSCIGKDQGWTLVSK